MVGADDEARVTMRTKRSRVVGLTLATVTLVVAGCGDSTTEAAAEISCTAAVQHGAAVTCTADGAPADAAIDWGDGTSDELAEAGTASHAYGDAGVYTPVLQQGDSTLTANQVEVAPVLSIECEQDTIRVWEIMEADADEGWDYVDGASVETGEGATNCAASVQGAPAETRVQWTFEPEGAAAGAGSVSGVGVAGEGIGYQWDGHQPGVATFSVVVNGVSASTSTMMYLSGCG